MKPASDFRLFGIFGWPLAHSLSPVMQEAAFEAAGLKAFYIALELEPGDFRRAMRGIKRFILDGFNVTVPYKATVMPYLDRLTPRARAIGAVNTVFRKGGTWTGDNTDCAGFLKSLREEGRFDPRGKKVLILGAGGAARAAAYGLAQSGAVEIKILNRPQFKARRSLLVRDFKKIFRRVSFSGFDFNRKNLRQALEGAQLVVNATSVGVVHQTKRLIPNDLIPRRRILFFDLVYHHETPFLKEAARKGHRTLGGLGMLVYQGAEAFRLWTGRTPSVTAMKKALLRKGLHV